MRHQQTGASERMVSIDALRGFDMFWISGGREFILGMLALVVHPFPAWLQYQAGHVDWIGFSAWDLIMPLFLFITGVALPFAMSARAAQPDAVFYRRLARRVALLWLLGMIAQGNLLECLWHWSTEELHLYSNTLQAIASGYLIAAVAMRYTDIRGQAVLCACLLLAYWLLLRFVPFPGHPAGTLEPQANLALWVDETILGRFRDGTTYTWILSSLAFAATVLLGVMGGHILRSDRAPMQKVFALLGMGIACLAGGWVWGLFFPIIKHLWTSSMVLWAAGWSFALLAVFHWAIDVRQYRKAAFYFTVIGANSILAYMAGEVWPDIFEYLFGDPKFGSFRFVLAASVAVASLWAILYALYRKKIFIRV